MKSTFFKRRRVFVLTAIAAFTFPGVASAFVTLAGNDWVVTSGSPASVKITGTLTTDGPLVANGKLTANGTLAASTLTATTLSTSSTITSTGALWAKSTLLVSGATTLTGNTTTHGDLSVYEGIDLGRAAGNSSLSAIQMDYYNTGSSLKTASFDLTDSLGNFRWQDNLIGTPRTKMKLDASNVLTLYNTAGAAAVTITPATGKIDLKGANGAGIYSDNVPVVAVGTAGTTSVSTSSLNVSGSTSINSLSASGATTLASLTVSGATILNGSVVLAAPQGDISMGDYE